MVQPAAHPIFLRDADGGITPFAPERLQTRLIGAFCRAGMSDESYLSGELVLALEYTLQRTPRADGIFNCGEVDAAMIHLLESNGFPEVANIFRRSGSEQLVLLETSSAAIGDLLGAHLGCSEARKEKISAMTAEAMAALQIPAASPHLLLELARHYEHHCPIAAEGTANAALSAAGEVAELTGKAASGSRILLTTKETAQFMPEAGKYLLDDKILQMGNVSRLYPNFRLGLNLALLAEKLDLQAPVTDLELAPKLYQIGELAGQWLRNLQVRLGNTQLPLYLILKDLDVFANRYLGAAYPEGRVAALETAAWFRNALAYPVKKVRCRTANSPDGA